MRHIGALALAAMIFTTSSILVSSECAQVNEVGAQSGAYALLPLPYGYDALEPVIDTHTLQIHHGRHHKAYVDNLNKAIAGTVWASMTMLDLFANAPSLPEKIRNNAGGHWNHTFYWNCITNNPGNQVISKRLESALTNAFGSIEKFKEQFRNTGLERFGSGYVWLVAKDGALVIGSTPNQDNPLMAGTSFTGKPLLVMDVWEHAYYLLYQNRRGDYLDQCWKIVDWKAVEKRLFED